VPGFSVWCEVRGAWCPMDVWTGERECSRKGEV